MLLWGRAIFVSLKPQGGCAEEEVAGLGGISRAIQWEGLHRAGAQAWSTCSEAHQVGLLTCLRRWLGNIPWRCDFSCNNFSQGNRVGKSLLRWLWLQRDGCWDGLVLSLLPSFGALPNVW